MWLKNTNMFFERSYKRIQDFFSYIGGVNNIINIIGFLINKLFNKFTTLCDTEKLLLSLINSEKINNINIKSIKIKNLSEKNINYNNKKNKEILNLNIMDRKEDIFERNKSDIKLDKSDNFFILNSNNNIPDKIKKKIINNENHYINKFEKNNTEEKKENFFDFLLFQLACGKKTNSFKIYDNFRKTIISEECFIKNHLNICNLMEIKEIKKTTF